MRLGETVTIRRAVLRRESDGQELRARHECEQELRGLSACSTLTPPSGILCVRNVRLSRARKESRPLQQAFAQEIRRFFSNAARPANGSVPVSAEAVYFEDYAELLACLGRDWQSNNIRDHWWWASIFPNATRYLDASQIWAENPRYIPTALTRLGSFSSRVAFIEAWNASTVECAIERVAEAFGAVELTEALTLVAKICYNDATERANAEDLRWRVCSEMLGTAAASINWPGPLRADIRPSDFVLVSLATMLTEAPRSARSAGFIETIISIGRLAPSELLKLSSQTVLRHPARVLSDSLDAPWLERRRAAARETNVLLGKKSKNAERSAAEETRCSAMADAVSPENGPAISNQPDQRLGPNQPSPRARFRTAWGGIFYLINVVLDLGWYGDFTQPRKCCLPIPIWDLLALIGVHILGEKFAQDEIWSALAALAGRDPESQPVELFDPAEWPLMKMSLSHGEWISNIAEIALDRLRTRYFPGLPPDFIADRLFDQSADIQVSCERVDIYFSLAALPIEIRISGLDRDPGWIPAAGCSLSFHFD